MNVRLGGLVVALNLAQLPVAMRPLLISLAGAQLFGGFTVAGLAGGAAAAGLAASAPWWARALPRHGDRRVLAVAGTVYLLAQVAFAFAATPAWFVGLAAVTGLTTPPVASSVRTLLRRLAEPASLSRAYTLNSVATEVVYVAGPLWVSAWLGFAGPVVALLVTGVTGAVALAAGAWLAPAGRPHRPGRTDRSTLLTPAVGTLAGAYLGYWVCMGAMWVLLPAFAGRAGAPAAAGVLVAVWSAGSVAGGVAVALLPRRSPARTRYLVLLGVLAATSLPLVLPGTVLSMGIAVGVFGLGLAGWLAAHDQVVAEAGGERAAELYGWFVTVGQIGSAAGSTVGGWLGDRFGGGPAFLVVSVALAAALALALGRRRTLPAGRDRFTAATAGSHGASRIHEREEFSMADKSGGPSEGIKGAVEGVKGSVKEAAGALFGNDSLHREGAAQQDKAESQREVAEKEAAAERARAEAAADEQRQRREQ
ncbi:MFS transporter [Amycolatopsis suaedae]|uniref:MFS transporter n=1 Tax=Amycolatopsis suaedae TaxID=2510978 RepID=A0A4Q7J6Q4_9PSEU|nr:MFS transporter [Amycolatopsis suaedae]